MSNKYQNHAQFELFPETSQQPKKIEKTRYLLKDLTLSMENIIVLSIISVMSLVLFFSYGVERGKKRIVEQDSEEVQSVDTVGLVKNDVVIKSEISSDFSEIQKVVSDEVIKPMNLEKSQTTIVPGIFSEKNLLLEENKIVEGAFTVQVASFKLEKNAEKEALRLKGKGHDTFVLPKGSYSIVCVGKFAQKIQAQEFSYQLRDRYRDLLVRRF